VDELYRLRKELDSQLRKTSLVKAVLEEQSSPEIMATLPKRYARYLSQIANQYAPHSPIVMALAASRCMSSHPSLARYLLHHAGDEQGHDSWAHEDLLALGSPRAEIESARPVPSCEAMIGYTYFVAEHANPVGLFGWMYILEAVGDDLGPIAAQKIRQKLGLSHEGVLFVAGHGEADQVHIKELEEQIIRHVTSEKDRSDVLHVAEVSADLYLRMFQEVDPGT
jgi:pyrroloquinoline quinone (PQQ) biosynthesis protein C